MHKYTITIAAIIACLTTSLAHSMIRKQKQICSLQSKQRILTLQHNHKQTINFLATLLEKPIPDFSNAFQSHPKFIQKSIEKRCGDAQGIIILAKLPTDMQHEVLNRMFNYDEKSAHLFNTMPLGQALTQYKKAHTRYYNKPIFIVNSLPKRYSLMLSPEACFRLSGKEHAALNTITDDLFSKDKITSISHSTKDIIATIPRDILEMVLQKHTYKLLPIFTEKKHCTRLAFFQEPSDHNFAVQILTTRYLLAVDTCTKPKIDRLYYKNQIDLIKDLVLSLEDSPHRLNDTLEYYEDEYQRRLFSFIMDQPILRFDDLGTSKK